MISEAIYLRFSEPVGDGISEGVTVENYRIPENCLKTMDYYKFYFFD